MDMDEEQQLYEDLRGANQRAFAQGHYMVAYYALAATLHCAIQMKDGGKMADVEQVATEQLQQVRVDAPRQDGRDEAAEVTFYSSLQQVAKIRRSLLASSSPPPIASRD